MPPGPRYELRVHVRNRWLQDIKDVGRAGQRVTFAEIEGPHNLMRKTPDEFCKAVIPFILGSGRPGPYTRT
eukprot:scaffold978_cov392-Prasinococcus_capsulatus_cf.AAC.13